MPIIVLLSEVCYKTRMKKNSYLYEIEDEKYTELIILNSDEQMPPRGAGRGGDQASAPSSPQPTKSFHKKKNVLNLRAEEKSP